LYTEDERIETNNSPASKLIHPDQLVGKSEKLPDNDNDNNPFVITIKKDESIKFNGPFTIGKFCRTNVNMRQIIINVFLIQKETSNIFLKNLSSTNINFKFEIISKNGYAIPDIIVPRNGKLRLSSQRLAVLPHNGETLTTTSKKLPSDKKGMELRLKLIETVNDIKNVMSRVMPKNEIDDEFSRFHLRFTISGCVFISKKFRIRGHNYHTKLKAKSNIPDNGEQILPKSKRKIEKLEERICDLERRTSELETRGSKNSEHDEISILSSIE